MKLPPIVSPPFWEAYGDLKRPWAIRTPEGKIVRRFPDLATAHEWLDHNYPTEIPK